MARNGNTEVEFNPSFFDSVLRGPKVENLVDAVAQKALSVMRVNAPVDTEAYRNGLHIEHKESQYRRVTRVVGSDDKTLLIESKTGNMARGLKAAKQ
jgi:hypothetical protein